MIIIYKLIVNGENIIDYSNNISWNNDTDLLGTQLSFDSIKEIVTGTVVQFFNDDTEIFRGIALNPVKKRWTWSYTCQDYSFYLKKDKVIKQFNGMTARSAIESLLGEAYITGNIVEIPTVIDKIYANKTLADIIDDILEQSQDDQGMEYFKEIEGNILYIRKLEEMKINPDIILPKEIDINMSMENMINKVTIISGDYENAVVQATAEDTTNQWFYGVLADIQTIDDKNIAQAQNIANNTLLTKNKVEYSSSFEVIAINGGDTIKSNRMIYIHAGDRLNGYYKIKTTQHTLSKGKHKVNITITW